MFNLINLDFDINLYKLLFSIIIYSFLGWIMETIYMSYLEKRFVKRGFLQGPFCIIYGVGAMITYSMFYSIQNNIILLYILGCIIPTIFEYLVGISLEYIFHNTWWDYSNMKWNYKGRICLFNSCVWGLLTILLFVIFQPIINYIYNSFSMIYLQKFILIWFIYFCIDFIFSSKKSIKNTVLSENINENEI